MNSASLKEIKSIYFFILSRGGSLMKCIPQKALFLIYGESFGGVTSPRVHTEAKRFHLPNPQTRRK